MTFVAAVIAMAAGGAVVRHLVQHVLPVGVGTFAVNVAGSFLAGLFVTWSGDGRIIVTVAGLGALTSVSAVAAEASRMIGRRRAVAYVTVMIVASIGAAWIGVEMAPS